MTIHVAPAPYLYDRWEDEVALEKAMLAAGTERMQDRLKKAREKHDMNRLRPYRSLLHEWVLPVSEGVQAWIAKVSSARGVKPIALSCMKDLEPDTAAMVALKSILRMLGIERRGIMAIAVEIGTWCEHEARAKLWSEVEKKDWRAQQTHFAERGSNAAHQRRSNISIFNRYIRDKLGWIGWTDEERLRVGLELIDIVIQATRRFYLTPDPDWTPKRGKGGAFLKRPYILEADQDLIQWLNSAMEDEMVYSPVFMPTLIPPLDWEGPREGGYYTPFVKTPFLISFRANHEDQKQRAIDEYEGIEMPEVYGAINHVQCTPWKINQQVLEVAQHLWDRKVEKAGLPPQEQVTVEPRPEGVEKGTEEYKEWARRAGEQRTENAKMVSNYLATRRVFKAASRMKDEPLFYFPHKLDFRSRMYPIPSDLSPQGHDLHRGVLTFARPKPVAQEDAGWLAVHLANCFGVDKVGYKERIAWVRERRDRWLAIDANPLEQTSWADEDDAWQCLAAIQEWVRWLREGEGMLSSLPIRVDGTCNGIQHLSAMIRDEAGGRSVNLVPGESPQDIYQEVADMLTELLLSRPRDKMAQTWLRVFDGRTPRKVAKRPVMILPYGGTKHAYFKYTMDWLKKDGDPDGQEIHSKLRAEHVSYLTPLLWDIVETKLEKAKVVMQWLQDCAIVASSKGLPLYWQTPAGFTVRHFYGKQEARQVKTRIDGQVIQLQDYKTTAELDPATVAKGIAPNFVHSMDASALMTCITYAKENGIDSLTAIHDAYGTVAADMTTLSACLREAFITTHRQPVLEQFLESCKYVAGADCKWPEMPSFGSLDLKQVRESPYFFG